MADASTPVEPLEGQPIAEQGSPDAGQPDPFFSSHTWTERLIDLTPKRIWNVLGVTLIFVNQTIPGRHKNFLMKENRLTAREKNIRER